MSEDDFKGTVSLPLVSNERAAATDGKVICPAFFPDKCCEMSVVVFFRHIFFFGTEEIYELGVFPYLYLRYTTNINNT